MKPMSLLLAVATFCSFTTTAAVQPQKPVVIKSGGEVCERYLLRKVAKEKVGSIQLVKLKAKERGSDRIGRDANQSPLVKLRVFKTKNKTLSESLRKWLDYMDIDYLAAFELKHKRKMALALRSVDVHNTGLSTSFQWWHVRSDNYSVEFMSMAENPRLIFWDRHGSLNYYVVEFSRKWFNDWDNVTLDLLRYRVSPEGKSQLVSEKVNVKCE